mgnify:CR=1 FL=1
MSDENQKKKNMKKYKNMNGVGVDDEENNHKYEKYYVGYNNQDKNYKISNKDTYDEESFIIQNKFFAASNVRPVELNEMAYFNGLFICECPVFIQSRFKLKNDKHDFMNYNRSFFVLDDKYFNVRNKEYKKGRRHKKYYLKKNTKVNIKSIIKNRSFQYFLVRIVTRYYKVYIRQFYIGRALQIKNEIIRKIKKIKLGI